MVPTLSSTRWLFGLRNLASLIPLRNVWNFGHRKMGPLCSTLPTHLCSWITSNAECMSAVIHTGCNCTWIEHRSAQDEDAWCWQLWFPHWDPHGPIQPLQTLVMLLHGVCMVRSSLQATYAKGHFTHKVEGPWPRQCTSSHWSKRRRLSKFTSH
jgi:hypothetical protein